MRMFSGIFNYEAHTTVSKNSLKDYKDLNMHALNLKQPWQTKICVVQQLIKGFMIKINFIS